MILRSAHVGSIVVFAILGSLAACGDDSETTGSGGAAASTGAETSASSGGGSGETGGGDTGGSGDTGGGGDGGSAEVCAATFRVLQKDAYKETAGRSSELWPPHTTTVLEVVCDGEAVDGAFQANHGTEPDAVDAAGDVILVEAATFSAAGSRAELLDLLDAYSTCDCDDETDFLSLDSLQGDLAADLLDTVGGYLQANLTCPDDSLGDLLTALQDGDFETALVIFPTCEWVGGASFEDGLSEAFAELLDATGEALADYHVCNNDAAVQKGLFDAFVSDGSLACPGGAICQGPLWFYSAD